MEKSLESNPTSKMVIQQQLTGLGTNCYLLYDPASLDAAIIDVAGPIDKLLATVEREDLHLRYFLLTHGHLDHVIGLPEIRNKFDSALTCMHANEFKNMQTHDAWAKKWAEETLGEEMLTEWLKDPEFKKISEFDVRTFDKPDLFLEDNQSLKFGDYQIRVLFCPGHSPGGLCFSINNFLFTGDVLFKGAVGRVDVQNSSREDQILSVRRLYMEFPDETLVYPGHSDVTSIGVERVGNKSVNETEINL